MTPTPEQIRDEERFEKWYVTYGPAPMSAVDVFLGATRLERERTREMVERLKALSTDQIGGVLNDERGAYVNAHDMLAIIKEWEDANRLNSQGGTPNANDTDTGRPLRP